MYEICQDSLDDENSEPISGKRRRNEVVLQEVIVSIQVIPK